MDRLDKKVDEFLDYEASQYDDICHWYAKLTEAVASKDATLLAQMRKAKVISERSRAIAADLTGRIRKFADDQMEGAESGSTALWNAIPPGGSLTLSAVRAGQAEAAKFNVGRKQSYSNSYKQITGKELSTK